MSDPVVVIGASAEQKLPALVCEHSILRHCPEAKVVQVFDREMPRWSGGMGTPFSFVRHWVPELCGNQGRAIYLDSDMIVFASVRGLWDLPMDGAAVLYSPAQFSVLIIDCEILYPWPLSVVLDDLEAGRISYAQVMQMGYLSGRWKRPSVPDEWNRLDLYEPNTSLLHYTNMRRQPWLAEGHPLAGWWFAELVGACASGLVTAEIVAEEIAAGHVISAVAEELKCRL